MIIRIIIMIPIITNKMMMIKMIMIVVMILIILIIVIIMIQFTISRNKKELHRLPQDIKETIINENK